MMIGGKLDEFELGVCAGHVNMNASFMLCPKPYGTLAHTDAQKASASSSMYEPAGTARNTLITYQIPSCTTVSK